MACPSAALAGSWQEVPSPIPPGGRYGTPPGYVSDLQFWAPNRGLMAVGGNASVTEGLYSYNGQAWHQLATVCGGGRAARIAWAGPTEFWVISRPSLPREQTAGLALCHFKDGEVVGSYSTPAEAEDPYRPMVAAACDGPSDCWFGGPFALDGLGRRSGAFHLHWDGTRAADGLRAARPCGQRPARDGRTLVRVHQPGSAARRPRRRRHAGRARGPAPPAAPHR